MHGHIHESPSVTGVWKAKIGKTICVNPGSSHLDSKLNFVIFELNNLENPITPLPDAARGAFSPVSGSIFKASENVSAPTITKGGNNW